MKTARAKRRFSPDFKRIAWCCGYLGILGLLWGVWFGYMVREKPTSDASLRSPSEGSLQPADPQTRQPTGRKSALAPSPSPVKLPFSVIREAISSLRGRARKEYASMLEGKRIRWAGWVYGVEEHRRTGLQLRIDMDAGSDMDAAYDVSFRITPDEAAKIKERRPIVFEGVIDSISLDRNCIVELNPGFIISQPGR